MDDDVFDVFGRQMDEVQIERELLIVRAAPSFGDGLPETEFFVRHSQFLTIYIKQRSSVVSQNLFGDILYRSLVLFHQLFPGYLFAEEQYAVFLYRRDMRPFAVAIEELLSLEHQYLLEFASFFGKRNSDEEFSVLIYPCVSVSDGFIDYLHVMRYIVYWPEGNKKRWPKSATIYQLLLSFFAGFFF